MLRLSVLDQSVAAAGSSEDAAIRDTISLASTARRSATTASGSASTTACRRSSARAPEILMAAIAAATSRIRIGSAGVMLPHYSALKVAEQFRVLEAHRARAASTSASAARRAATCAPRSRSTRTRARGRGLSGPGARPAGLGRRATLPRATLPASARIRSGRARPRSGSSAAPTTARSSRRTSACPMPSPISSPTAQGAEQAIALYRSLYKPSERHPEPQATLCVWALVADSDEEAQHHALCRDRWRVDRMRGVFGPLQSPDDVAARGFAADELPTLESMRRKAFVGSAERVGTMLRALAQKFALDEVVINTWAHDPAVRRRSYALLAREFELA